VQTYSKALWKLTKRGGWRKLDPHLRCGRAGPPEDQRIVRPVEELRRRGKGRVQYPDKQHRCRSKHRKRALRRTKKETEGTVTRRWSGRGTKWQTFSIGRVQGVGVRKH